MCKGALLAEKVVEPEQGATYVIGLLTFSRLGVLHQPGKLPDHGAVKVHQNTRLLLSNIPHAFMEGYGLEDVERVRFETPEQKLHDYFVFENGLRLTIASLAGHDILARIYLPGRGYEPVHASLPAASVERQQVAA